jgi:putative transcriptional regulator
VDLNVKNTHKPAKGTLLLSEPFLQDEYFSRSVILLCEHNEESSFGFVLNNYLEVDLREISTNFPDIATRISLGGPVSNQNLYFIHTLGDKLPGSTLVTDSIYIGGNFDELVLLLQSKPELISCVRFFLGYSGWNEGQLDAELKENSWLVINEFKESEIMDSSYNDLWKDLITNQGGKYKMMANFPLDPRLN